MMSKVLDTLKQKKESLDKQIAALEEKGVGKLKELEDKLYTQLKDDLSALVKLSKFSFTKDFPVTLRVNVHAKAECFVVDDISGSGYVNIVGLPDEYNFSNLMKYGDNVHGRYHLTMICPEFKEQYDLYEKLEKDILERAMKIAEKYGITSQYTVEMILIDFFPLLTSASSLKPYTNYP